MNASQCSTRHDIIDLFITRNRVACFGLISSGSRLSAPHRWASYKRSTTYIGRTMFCLSSLFLTTREAAWYISSVVTVFCLSLYLSDDNFRKHRRGSSYLRIRYFTSGIISGNTGQVRI